MENSGRVNLLGSIMIIVSVGIFTFGIISFGRSFERGCSRISNSGPTHIPSSIKVELSSNSLEIASQAIAQGMKNSPAVKIPSNMNFTLSSSSLEKASKNISDGIKQSAPVRIPSDMKLRLDDGRGIKINLHKTDH